MTTESPKIISISRYTKFVIPLYSTTLWLDLINKKTLPGRLGRRKVISIDMVRFDANPLIMSNNFYTSHKNEFK